MQSDGAESSFCFQLFWATKAKAHNLDVELYIINIIAYKTCTMHVVFSL
jgi:hypothetical protein